MTNLVARMRHLGMMPDRQQSSALKRLDSLRASIYEYRQASLRYSEELIVWHEQVREHMERRAAEDAARQEAQRLPWRRALDWLRSVAQ